MPLTEAIRKGDLAAVIDQVRTGADINRPDADGFTPLMIASGLALPQIVECLLAAGANVLALEPNMGATALHKAALSGNADVIALLLDHGAFIDQQSPSIGHTPLMDAVLHKHEGAVKILLDRGARTRLRSHAGHTALDYARADDLSAIVQLIEARDAQDARRIADQSLMAAVRRDDVAGVKAALDDGAIVDERLPVICHDDDDFTPLGLAAREGRVEIVRLLLRAGADARAVNGMMQGAAAHEAAYFGHADAIRTLAEAVPQNSEIRAAVLDAQGVYNGFTPLHDAVWHGHSEAAKALVDAGARVDLRTHAGLTPHELALHCGYEDLARLLSAAERNSGARRTAATDSRLSSRGEG